MNKETLFSIQDCEEFKEQLKLLFCIQDPEGFREQLKLVQDRLTKIQKENPLPYEPVDAEVPFPDGQTAYFNNIGRFIFNVDRDVDFRWPTNDELNTAKEKCTLLDATILAFKKDEIAEASKEALVKPVICPYCGK